MKIKLIFAVTLLLISHLSLAEEKTFKWSRPTDRTDGTPITDAELREYPIYCDGSTTPVWVQPKSGGNDEIWIAPDGWFSTGDHTCQISAVDTDGQEGPLTDPVSFTVASGAPPPSLLASPKAPRRFRII